MCSISFIGAGNVAMRFSLALAEAGYKIGTIYGRSEKNVSKVVKTLERNGFNAKPSFSISDVFSSSVVIIAVSDNAIPQVVSELVKTVEALDMEYSPIFLHTSGATDINVFDPLKELGVRCGVLYPLMTLLESMDGEIDDVLDEIATNLNSEHYFYSSKDRLKMHVAAVFTCNFVNHILSMGFSVIGRDTPLLLPLTLESVRNCFLHSPDAVLTGPARRGDMVTIEKHLGLLEELGMGEQKEIYSMFTDMIMKKFNK